MSTPAGDDLVGGASVRITADTDPALRAISRFSRDAQTRLTSVQRSLSAATRELRTLRTTATNVRIDVRVSGQAEISAAANAIRDLLRDANSTANGLRSIATRATAAAAALGLLESAAKDAARTLRTLRGRLAAVTIALTELRPAATQAAAALRRLAQRADDSVNHLNDLDNAALGASVRIDGLSDSLRTSNDDLRDLTGNLRDLTRALNNAGNTTNRTTGENDRLHGSLGAIASVAGRAGKALGPVVVALGAAGAAAGTVVPLLAGLAAALESIAPAAAVGASATLALGVVSNTLKVGMIGLGEAIETAFDPEAKPEDLAAAMERLAPQARAFVSELSGMKKELNGIRLDIQNRLFTNFDGIVERLGGTTLKRLATTGKIVADQLNEMAHQAATAAADFGESGAFGTALNGTIISLRNLERVPAQAVTAFGQLAAASAPAFTRITSAAGNAFDRITEKLSKAFESGALEDAINQAVDNIAQLGRIAGNVFGGLGNIIKAVSVDGQGLFGTLEKITQAFEDLTASKEFQSALRQLSQTMSTLVSAVLPLVQEAFKALLPLIEILAPPLRELIKHLGEQLRPVIQKLGPVLEALAEAFVKLIPVLTPIIDLGLKLISAVLPILTPLFEHLGEVAERLAPIVEQLADNIAAQLEPILAVLPEILEQILPLFLELADQLLPLLLDVLEQIGPSLGEVAQSIADLLIELTPLLVKFLEFQVFLLEKMMPIMGPLAELIGKVLVNALGALTVFIEDFVIPIVQTIVAILNGDWDTAMRKAGQVTLTLRDNAVTAFGNMKRLVTGAIVSLASSVISRFQGMAAGAVDQMQRLVNGAIVRIASLPGRAFAALSDLSGRLRTRAAEAGLRLVAALGERLTAAVALIASLPGRAAAALGNLGGRLIASGRALIGGFIRGILDRISDVAAAASSVVSKAREFFPFSPAKEGAFSGRGWVLYSGRAIGESLAQGLAQREALVQRAARMVAQTAREAVTIPAVTVPTITGPLGVGAALGVGATRTSTTAGLAQATVNVTLNLTNAGVIGSRRELQGWLTGMLDDLRLQGRLPMGSAA